MQRRRVFIVNQKIKFTIQVLNKINSRASIFSQKSGGKLLIISDFLTFKFIKPTIQDNDRSFIFCYNLMIIMPKMGKTKPNFSIFVSNNFAGNIRIFHRLDHGLQRTIFHGITKFIAK
ncbi:MAG: hypothetical protein BWY43_00659 [candidate division WS2 bacterium ADurb.Bin280]|uniref:Uncharacterized protein n=1 Tax=candidate division WS2 bacterium ADurb.Bin280 TaxID=1852829 RepID=A0A1V5SC42_9BACT|nr:MAG: hypothetical protein BWY43_00659 [candidate division WS2 bacterium ADurb.Bin280]